MKQAKAYQRRWKKKQLPVTLPELPSRVAVDPPPGLKVALGTITDPYGFSETAIKGQKRSEDGSSAPGEGEWIAPSAAKIVILRSIRTDPLGWSHSHGNVTDPEYLAGRHWQMLFERSQIGSIQAVDTSKEPVDGGKTPELVTDGQRVALMALRRSAAALETSVPGDRSRGIFRKHLVHEVLAEGKFMRQIAADRGFFSRSAVGALSREFRRSLGILALVFGFASAPTTKSKIRSYWEADNDNQENNGQEEDHQAA